MVCTTLNMDHRKLRTELSQEIRKKIIDKHVNGKGRKTISKQLDIPVTTVAHIIQKFKVQGTVANLPGRGCERKIDDKLKRRIIRMVTKEPRTTSNEIRGELQGQGTSVSDRTIRRCLSQSRPRRTPLLVESKSYKRRDWNLPKCILTSHRASGRMSFGQMRQNWCQGTGVRKQTRVAGLVTHDLPSGLLRTQMQRSWGTLEHHEGGTKEKGGKKGGRRKERRKREKERKKEGRDFVWPNPP